MTYHQFGSTSLEVTRIGLGLAALGRPGYINRGRNADLGADRSATALERRTHEMLDAAYAAGLRYVDAARSYGMAEAFLASWLHKRQLTANDITIGSKWGYTYTGDWKIDAPTHEVKNLSADTLTRQVRESRALLGDRLRLYQIHSATIESGVLDDDEVLEMLLALRSEGVVIGLTVTGPRQADTILRSLDVRIRDVNLFQSVQATWNLLEPSAGDALARAHSAGCGVIVKEVLANGRLTDRNVAEEARALQKYSRLLGAPLDVVAFAAALANPWADVVLSGAVTQDQLLSNVRGLTIAVDVDTLPCIAVSAQEYWAARSDLKWE